ncbi:MAG: hypothetical protein F6J90_29860 [Moorea sp. SIOASIH]|uniref:hypothetical protein n=1 Tax=Moorena sp. SIOASIH TaxID=2607817 RepID=UPI0013B919D9|nr:hypothetical protein [Moorena sp. SIOASIH]NEO40325.1 hypothetical protein [Moorena sp. SIOASIH]
MIDQRSRYVIAFMMPQISAVAREHKIPANPVTRIVLVERFKQFSAAGHTGKCDRYLYAIACGMKIHVQALLIKVIKLDQRKN